MQHHGTRNPRAADPQSHSHLKRTSFGATAASRLLAKKYDDSQYQLAQERRTCLGWGPLFEQQPPTNPSICAEKR